VLCGYDALLQLIQLDRNEYEYEFIAKIVKEVTNRINRDPLHVADYPVGLQSRLLQVNSLLNVQSHDEVCMVRICGTSRMGKTHLHEQFIMQLPINLKVYVSFIA
jgi:hypothetical protein